MGKITVRNENEMRMIDLEKLLAVTVADYLCTFHSEGNTSFSCTKSLKDAQALLPDYFVRISRSCIVNTDKIVSIDLKNKKVIVTDNKEFLISKTKSLNTVFKNTSERKFTS